MHGIVVPSESTLCVKAEKNEFRMSETSEEKKRK